MSKPSDYDGRVPEPPYPTSDEVLFAKIDKARAAYDGLVAERDAIKAENERLRGDLEAAQSQAAAMREAILCLSEDLRSEPEFTVALASDAGQALLCRLKAAEVVCEIVAKDIAFDEMVRKSDRTLSHASVDAVAAWKKERGVRLGGVG